jgi:hypothetical protein
LHRQDNVKHVKKDKGVKEQGKIVISLTHGPKCTVIRVDFSAKDRSYAYGGDI